MSNRATTTSLPAANVVDNLLAASRRAEIVLPVDLELSSIVEARYTGDATSQLVKRLRDVQGSEHDEALAALGAELGPERVWAAFCSLPEDFTTFPSGVAGRLVRSGALPTGDALADVLSSGSTDKVVSDMVWSATKLRRTSLEVTPFTLGGLLRLADARSFPLEWVMSHLVEEIPSADVATLVARVDVALEADPTRIVGLARDGREHHFPIVSGEDSQKLLDGGFPCSERAAAVVLARFGAVYPHRERFLELDGAVVCDAANTETYDGPYEGDLKKAIRKAAKARPEQLRLLPSGARRWTMENVLLSDEVLTMLLDRELVTSWLVGSLANKPTRELVSEAIDRDLVDADVAMRAVRILASSAPHAPTAHWDRPRVRLNVTPTEVYLSECLQRVPGMAPQLLAVAAEQPSASTATILSLVLPHLVEVLGDEERLWERFVSASVGSPFLDPSLTLVEAANRFRTRWAEAARRTGRTA